MSQKSWPLFLALLGAPIVWAVHLAASYFLVALDCGTRWNGGKVAIVLTTVLSVAAAAAAGGFAWKGWTRGRNQGDVLDPPEAREFLVAGGVILAALFAGAIVLAGVAPLILPLCG